MPEVVKLNDTIADRLVTHQVQVLRLASGALLDVTRILVQADKDTYQALEHLANDDGLISQGKIDRILNQTLTINNRAYKEINSYLHRELRALAHYEVEFNRDLLDTHLPFRYHAKRPARGFVAAIVDEEPMHGGLLSEWIEGMSQGRYNRVRAQIRIGIANGEPVNSVITSIRGKKALGRRDGVASINVRSLKMLVNTVYNHIANKARLDFYGANSDIVFGYMWSAVLDDVTCATCAGLDGETFRPDAFDFTPPAHLNCRCVAIPVFEPLDADYEFPKPKKLRYEDWLSNQKASLQDEILGPARAAMFRHGMPLRKFSDASGVRYNLMELRQIEAKDMATKTKTADKPKGRVLKNWGYKPDLPDQRDHLFGVAHPEALAYPVKVSLRDKMPAVFDQGDLGSCVANALVGAHMFAHKREHMQSRLDLYYHARLLEGMESEDSGCMIRDGVKALATWGVASEYEWPYKIRKFASDPPPHVAKDAMTRRITEYQRLRSHDDFMKCLAQGRPFTFGFSVYENIYSHACENHGILAMPAGNDAVLGGHAVVAVGYDQNFHSNPVFVKSELSKGAIGNFVYEIRNSWGADWGDAGHMWMDAAMLESRDVSDDFWAIFD